MTGRTCRMLWVALLGVLIMLISACPVQAQASRYDVFLRVGQGQYALYFVDAVTGLSTITAAEGAAHTLLAEGVLYLDAETNQPVYVTPDGQRFVYTAITAPGQNETVTWVVSANREWLVWAFHQRRDNLVESSLYVMPALDAPNAERARRIALTASSVQGIGLQPVMVTDDGASVYYDQRNDLFGEQAQPLPLRDLRRLDVTSGATLTLPIGQGCPCPTAFSPDGRYVARFAPARRGYTVSVLDSLTGVETPILSAGLPNNLPSTLTGMALSADGRRALYTLVANNRTTVILAETQPITQNVIGTAREPLRPVGFVAEGGAATLIGAGRSGTWKLVIPAGPLVQVSAYSFLGTLGR